MMPAWCRDEVTILRAPLVDTGRGSVERDWTNPERVVISGCYVQRSSTSTDRGEPREASSVVAVLLAPPGADVRAGDRVLFGGVTYVVQGVPNEHPSPHGTLDHVRAELYVWEG